MRSHYEHFASSISFWLSSDLSTDFWGNIVANAGIRIVAIGVAFYLVTAAATAEAAKGVKKAGAANGQHRTLTGIVQNITPNQTGYGTFRLRTAYHHKKMGLNNAALNGANANAAAGNGANGNGQNGIHELTVGTNTRFEFYNGTMALPTVLKNGQHVRVRTTGQQAEIVQVMNHQRSLGSFSRHRSMSYHPHNSYYHRRR
jgi:hypothetical protein